MIPCAGRKCKIHTRCLLQWSLLAFFFLPLQFYELKFAFQVESEDVFTELEEVNKVII